MLNPESSTHEDKAESQAYPKMDPKFGKEKVGRGDFDKQENPQEKPKAKGPKPEAKADARYDYEILGVSPDASPDEIKKAYKKMAKETHPDMGGSPEDFKRVTGAFESLLNRATGAPENKAQAQTQERNNPNANTQETRRPFTGKSREDIQREFEERMREADENNRKRQEEIERETEALRKEIEERFKKGKGNPENTLKRCSNCGKEIPASNNFCTSCGTRLK